jgi:transposase-like protein
MTKSIKSPLEQEAIVAEYLLGNISYRLLGKKYGVDFRLIHLWVMKFQGNQKSKQKEPPIVVAKTIEKESPIVLELRESLRKEKLRNELLNTIIDVADKDLQINIRKKFGTKQ